MVPGSIPGGRIYCNACANLIGSVLWNAFENNNRSKPIVCRDVIDSSDCMHGDTRAGAPLPLSLTAAVV